MITNGLPQEVETSQYGCGALRTLQKVKFYKDTQVCTVQYNNNFDTSINNFYFKYKKPKKGKLINKAKHDILL